MLGILICLFVGMVTGAGLTFFVLYPQYLMTGKQRREAVAARTAAEQLARQTIANNADLQAREKALADRVIRYDELAAENKLLKRDLQNIDVTLHKSILDHDVAAEKQSRLDARANDLARRYLKEATKWAFGTLTVNNFANVKAKLEEAFARCRGIGFQIPNADEAESMASLKAEYERLVKAAVEREEQARIKAQIREEARLQREAEEELERTARERIMIERALAEALSRTQDQHTAEVEALRAQLAEAEAKSQRAISMAQQTKAGNVYVISNIGAFGEGVFKVGMTRRLEPKDRIKELGDASVPFPFDIHMMISCNDAPALENALHRKLHRSRLNRVNPRKEFFRADIDSIVRIVKEHHGEVQYQADPEALEYRQSMTISDDDAAFIEEAYEQAESTSGFTSEVE